MSKFEDIKIKSIKGLKQPTIYYFLKENSFSEHYIKNLRNISGSIFLNGIKTTIREKIKVGDVISISTSPNKKTDILLCDGDIKILYEDDDYLIVFKPHNLACIPTRSHYTQNLGGQICKYMSTKDENFVLRIINRLDKETAGIVIIAKNIISRNSIKNIYKEYHALCSGILKEDEITINEPIETVTINGINQIKRIVSENGKPAITHVKVLKRFTNSTLISVTLETGRTHQIRVHLSHIGHPLIGDTLYNPDQNNIINHTMLLLKKVSFIHFRTGQKKSIETEETLI